MNSHRPITTVMLLTVSILSVFLVASFAEAHRGPQRGRTALGISNPGIQQEIAQRGAGPRGRGYRGGSGAGPQRGGRDEDHAKDMQAIQFLLTHRDQISRSISNRPDGVVTVTESDNPEVTAILHEHVEAMYKRVEKQKPIHVRDPLFAELFRNASTLKMKVERTDNGVKVTETSTNPYSVKLIQAHARVVSLFLQNGHLEVRKNHEIPK